MKRAFLFSAVLIAVPLGCAGEEAPPPTSDCGGQQVGDACAGVPSEPLCTEGACTVGSCGQTFEVSSETQLDEALGAAQSGDCVSLDPGSYGAVDLPEGVSLFGLSAHTTSVASVTTRGADVRVRGVTVDGGATVVASGETRIEAVRMVDGAADALEISAGASVTLERSEVRGAAGYGIRAFDAGSVTVSETVVAGNTGPGMWLECSGGCGCTGSVSAEVRDSWLSANGVVGVSVVGAEASFDNVAVRESTTDDQFAFGGGMSISQCSSVTATGLRVVDNVDFGVLIDDSVASVTEATIEGNLRGIAIQNIGASAAGSVTVEGTTVRENRGVGIGVDGASVDVTLRDTAVVDTQLIALPVKIDDVGAGMEQVGDGIAWLGVSQVDLDSVTVSGSARASVLIDGEVGAGSSITDLLLEGGDESMGVLQQSLPSNGTQPSVSGSSPELQTSTTEQFPVPLDVSIPPGI